MTSYRGAIGYNTAAKKPNGLQRGLIWGAMIIGALLAFEMFNFSTTQFALADLLGDLSFAGLRWATILAIAFCGIDFAGIARLFTPERDAEEPAEVWYLLGAWLLAATMNAMLTWWGVSIAIHGHESLGNGVVGRETMLTVVPIFVAVMVWLSRVLIIGTFSIAGERLFSQADARPGRMKMAPARRRTSQKPLPQPSQGRLPKPAFRPKPKQVPRPNNYNPGPAYNPRPEPTYHPVGARARHASAHSNGAPAAPKNFQ
jgi:hypothetical protein